MRNLEPEGRRPHEIYISRLYSLLERIRMQEERSIFMSILKVIHKPLSRASHTNTPYPKPTSRHNHLCPSTHNLHLTSTTKVG